MNSTRTQDARLFRSLHDPRQPLALSNVWDVASALIVEAAGASAVATTSAGLAWSLGYPDGEVIGRAKVVAAVAAIAAAVRIPVTADIEGGYAGTADGVAETVQLILEAGAVGINIEDGARSPAELASRIASARRAAERAEMPLFINARTDVFLAGIGAPETRSAETLARAARYVDAGADGIFIPGVADSATVAALTADIRVPVNVMAVPGGSTVKELGRLGVARVSLGSAVAQAAYAVVQRSAVEMLAYGTYDATLAALGFGELDGLMATSNQL